MEGLFFVFIIVALLSRVIEAMAKGQGKGKGQPQPPARRPRPQYDRPHGTTRPKPYDALPGGAPGQPRDGVPRDATPDAAAEMIPDELWELLTGQPKPRRAPPPPPAPWEEEADLDEVTAIDRVEPLDEVEEWEARRQAEEAQRRREHRDLMARRLREQEMYSAKKAPAIVSLERPLPTAATRHAVFHQQLDAPPPAVPGQRAPRPSARDRLFAGDDMRRAFVLQEVFGKPKGLE